jgi:hypothetical protein
MKYMIMMFGDGASMMATKSSEWIGEMIGFMTRLDEELRDSGELVYQTGLADGSAAKTYRAEGGTVTATDGPYAEAKESLIGYWIVDVADEARVAAIASRIVEYAGVVEVRPVMDAPPEM